MKQYRDTFSWTNPNVEARPMEEGGFGVFAKKDIPKDAIIAIFGGYIMSIEEEQKLPELFSDNSVQISEDLVLGIKNESEMEIACFFNHSCDPNAGFHGQIYLVAMKDIYIDEEVTFDYAMVLSQSKEGDQYKLDCWCHSLACRKIITSDDWKKKDLQVKYRGYFQYYLEEKIRRMENNPVK